MFSAAVAKRMAGTPREIEIAQQNDEILGDLKLLPGIWKNTEELNGRGWNMIALPFISPGFKFNYRLLVNQYNETLSFTIADKFVKNRGIDTAAPATNTDQAIVALDYEQAIKQVAAADFPDSGGLVGAAGLPIHHEPGLWLVMSQVEDGRNDISRLATIPHGDSLLAIGTGNQFGGRPKIPEINGLPSGASRTMIDDGYLQPYDHFDANPFKGIVTTQDFPGFNPKHPHRLLEGDLPGTVVKTTELKVSTTTESGGILNIPFIEKQANAVQMNSTFWLLELAEQRDGKPRVIMQYLQVVMLDFFPRGDNLPGMARWPHVSINTMERVEPPEPKKLTERSVSVP